MAQLSALGAAAALGAAGGLVYDLLRVLRRRRPGLTHAADGLFALLCLLGTLWVLTQVGGGEPQLYMLLGSGAGRWRTPSPPMPSRRSPPWRTPTSISSPGRRSNENDPAVFPGAGAAAAHPGPGSGTVRKKIAAKSKKRLPFCEKVRYTKYI